MTMAGTWPTLRLSADNWATGLKVRSQMEQGLVMLEWVVQYEPHTGTRELWTMYSLL